MTILGPLIVHLNFPYDSKIFINQLSHMSSISSFETRLFKFALSLACSISVAPKLTHALSVRRRRIFFGVWHVSYRCLLLAEQRDWYVFALIHVIMTAGWTMVNSPISAQLVLLFL